MLLPDMHATATRLTVIDNPEQEWHQRIAVLHAAGDVTSGSYKSVVSSLAQGSVVAQAIQKDYQTFHA